MLGGRGDLVEDVSPGAVGFRGEHLGGEELDDRREIGFFIQCGIEIGPGERVAAQQGRHPDHRNLESGALQVSGVGRDDLPPERVQVGLGGEDRRYRAQLDGLAQESQRVRHGERIVLGRVDHLLARPPLTEEGELGADLESMSCRRCLSSGRA